MKYLKNSICDFEILFEYTNDKKNIISLSFFKMYNGGYKNFDIYIDGFMKLQEFVINEKKYNFVIRLFIDNNIKNDIKLFNKINNLDRVEIVVYKCHNFLQPENDNYHLGIFGMFVRFFPLFDFENNDANIVMIADMDDSKFFLENINVIESIDNNLFDELYIFYESNLSKNIKHNYNYLYKNKLISYFISPRLISLKRLPNLLSEYLNYITYYYSKAMESYEYIMHNKNNKKIKNNSNFIYGVDEYFLNDSIIKYIIDNNLSYGFSIKFNLFNLIYYYYKNYSYKKNNLKYINYILDYIFLNLNIKNNKKYNIKDKIIILEKLDNKQFILVNYYFYKTIIYNYYNKNYNFMFPKDFYNMIKIYDLFGIYEFNGILYNYSNNNFKLKFIKKKKFENKLLNKLKLFAKKYTNLF